MTNQLIITLFLGLSCAYVTTWIVRVAVLRATIRGSIDSDLRVLGAPSARWWESTNSLRARRDAAIGGKVRP